MIKSQTLLVSALLVAAFGAQGAVITNNSFENALGNGAAADWNDTSVTFGSNRCTATCGTGAGSAGPNTGAAWLWFGGTSAAETGSAFQSNVIPVSTGAVLSFYVWLGLVEQATPFSFTAAIDGNTLLTLNNANPVTAGYQYYSYNITPYADGNSHTVAFNFSKSTGGVVNLGLDDVDITLRGASQVPEPATYLLSASALLGLAMLRRRR